MMKWEKIKSLGDQAIFLACNDSVCVQADESTVYKKNCIYFTDDLCNGRSPSKEFGMYDLGMRLWIISVFWIMISHATDGSS